jgi:hypothetical protein
MNKKEPVPEHAVIRLPLNYIAFWQAMTFFMLICAVWACEEFGLLHDGPPDFKRAALLTLVLILGGIIIVAHSYLQERKALHGLLTICSYCRKVRIDENAWTQIEQFVVDHSSADFTHGVCPGCYQRLTAEMASKANADRGPLT